MFNIGPAELLIIAIVVLLIFPPKQLPDVARTVGKFIRDFRKQTDEVRSTIEREFYQMDQEISLEGKAKTIPEKSNGGSPGNTTSAALAATSETEVAPPTAEALSEENGFHPGELPPETTVESSEGASVAPQEAGDGPKGTEPKAQA